MQLSEFISQTIQRPLSSLGKAAIRAYEQLPGSAGWAPPPDFQPYQAHQLLVTGWPFALVGSAPGLDRLVGKFALGQFDRSDWGVIHAGALLRTLGASVEFPNEEIRRTADIRASWKTNVVDVEVTSPMEKERQAELERIMTNLKDVISDPPSLKWSDLKYVFWHRGGLQWRGRDTSPRRS